MHYNAEIIIKKKKKKKTAVDSFEPDTLFFLKSNTYFTFNVW